MPRATQAGDLLTIGSISGVWLVDGTPESDTGRDRPGLRVQPYHVSVATRVKAPRRRRFKVEIERGFGPGSSPRLAEIRSAAYDTISAATSTATMIVPAIK